MNLKIIDKYGREYEGDALPQDIDRLVIKVGGANFYFCISENDALLLECDEEFFFNWKGRVGVELVRMKEVQVTQPETARLNEVPSKKYPAGYKTAPGKQGL